MATQAHTPASLKNTTLPDGLRILLVIESAGGGSGRHVLDLAEGLLESGHSVALVFSMDRAERWFATRAAGLTGLRLHRVRMSRRPCLGDIRAGWQIRRVIREDGPFDIVHGHSSKAGALARVAALGTGAAAVYTPHAFITLDPDLGTVARYAYGIAERVLARLGSAVICVSENERQHALELGIDADKLACVPNGLKPLPVANRRAARRELRLADNQVCVGFVGRISHQKAVDRLLSAVANIRRRLAELRLVIVGDGPELDASRRLADNLGIGAITTFTGAADGVQLMAGFDVFALSSRYEGFPYVLLEASARGLPIVTTDIGGAAAVVEPGRSGFIVSQSELRPLEARMEEICRDDQLRLEMGMRSREIAETFSVESMVSETIGVYRWALSK